MPTMLFVLFLVRCLVEGKADGNSPRLPPSTPNQPSQDLPPFAPSPNNATSFPSSPLDPFQSSPNDAPILFLLSPWIFLQPPPMMRLLRIPFNPPQMMHLLFHLSPRTFLQPLPMMRLRTIPFNPTQMMHLLFHLSPRIFLQPLPMMRLRIPCNPPPLMTSFPNFSPQIF